MPLDYYVWAIVNAERTVLIVDTGFDQDTARRRGRSIVRPVADGLGAIGISPDQVEHIVISHMHYDHAGNHDLFPGARYHLQDAEMAYCTGRCMAGLRGRRRLRCRRRRGHDLTRYSQGRVQFHDGDEEIAPGISAAQGWRSHARHADRASGDRAGLGRARFRHRALLRQPRTGSAVSDPRRPARLRSRRSAPRCGWRARRSISFRVTIRWCWRATRVRRAGLEGVARLDLAPRCEGRSHDRGSIRDPRAARFHRRRAHGWRDGRAICWLRDIRSRFTTPMRRP